MNFAKDGLLTGQQQACTRITQLVVFSVECHHAKNGLVHKKMVVECPQMITSIGETLLQTRPGQRNDWSSQSFA